MKTTALLTGLIWSIYCNISMACTLREAQDNFSRLNRIFHVYSRQIAEYTRQGKKAPDMLVAKHRELIDVSAAIRKLFSKEIEKNAHMKRDEEVDPEICKRYKGLIARHAANMPEKQVQPRLCRSENMGNRFGAAVRKQRQLRIAGKISKKEQIEYLNIAREIRANTDTNFERACQALYRYEDKLKAEETDNTNRP